MEQEYKYMVCTSCMTYNHAPYIVDAMNGFVMQETTFPVYYLITDDASTDGEPEVIRQYLLKHFQEPYRTEKTDDYYLICAVHKTNPNCNFIVFFLKYNHYSIKKSKLPYQAEWRDNAKYIALCEGDDYWIHPKKLQMQVDYLENNDGCGLVRSNINRKFQEGKCLEEHFFLNFSHEILDNLQDYILHSWFAAPCTWVYRSSLRKSMPNLNPNKYFTGDTLLLLHFCSNSDIHYIEEVFANYRILEMSASHFKDYKFQRLFWMKNKNTRLFYAKKQPISFRLKFWIQIVKEGRPSFKSHIEYVPLWLWDSCKDIIKLI